MSDAIVLEVRSKKLGTTSEESIGGPQDSSNLDLKPSRKHRRRPKWSDQLKLIELVVATTTNLGYYTFSKPYYWNYKTSQMNIPKSKTHAKIRKLFLIGIVCSSICQLFFLARDLNSGTIPFRKFSTIVRSGIALLSTFCTIFQVHTHFRKEDVKDFTNLSLSYLELMLKDKIIRSKITFDMICASILIMIVIAFIFLNGVILGLFINDCEIHVFSHTPLPLPVCRRLVLDTGEIVFSYSDTPTMVFCSIGILFLASQHIVSMTCYLQILTIPVFGCAEVLGRMEEECNDTTTAGASAESKPKIFKTEKKWLLHYRCLQMLFTRINICAGEYIFPFALTGSVMFLIIVNYAVISLPISIMIIGFFITNVIIAVFFGTVVKQGIYFGHRSKSIVQAKKGTNFALNDYYALQLETCWPLWIKFNMFFHLELFTLSAILDIVIQYTINCVLTFNV